MKVSARDAIKKNTEIGHTREMFEFDPFNIRVEGGGGLLSFEKEEWVLHEHINYCQFQSKKGKDIINEETLDKWEIIYTK